MAHRWTAPTRWLLVILVLAAIVGTRAPDRLLSQWAYAVEKGKLQAVGDDLASVEEVSNAFRNVARLAQVGVVQINVAGDPNELAEVRRQVERRLNRPLTDERWQRFLREHPQGTASGILMDAQGHILTNNHVVGGKTGITVRLHDGRSYEAQLRGTDPETDIAVLKIEARELHPLRFGDSDKMEVGDWVLAVGAPLGLTHTVTHGIISAKGRSDIISGREIFFQDFFQTDAAINRGNSGGPLLNLRGEVIGLNTAVALNDDGGNAGIAFTIPSNIALHIADQLKRTGAVARGWLGVRLADLDTELVELFGLESDNGVMVDMVYADSPGQRAGLQCEDIIVEVNGVQVTGMRRLQALIGFVSPGKDADFKGLRDGRPGAPKAHLRRRPADLANFTRENALIAGRSLPRLPYLLRSMNEGLPGSLITGLGRPEVGRLARQLVDERGVLVIAPQGEARGEPELQAGELIRSVNGKRVLTVAQLGEALHRAGRQVELEIVNSEGVKRTVRVPGE